MRIAIVGSRTLPGIIAFHATVQRILDTIETHIRLHNTGPTIVSGGASGVDSIAEGLAKGMNFPTIILKPDWKAHGKAGGFKRNQRIVDAADMLMAFHFADSPGTADTIRRALASGKPTVINRWNAGTMKFDTEFHNRKEDERG